MCAFPYHYCTSSALLHPTTLDFFCYARLCRVNLPQEPVSGYGLKNQYHQQRGVVEPVAAQDHQNPRGLGRAGSCYPCVSLRRRTANYRTCAAQSRRNGGLCDLSPWEPSHVPSVKVGLRRQTHASETYVVKAKSLELLYPTMARTRTALSLAFLFFSGATMMSDPV